MSQPLRAQTTPFVFAGVTGVGQSSSAQSVTVTMISAGVAAAPSAVTQGIAAAGEFQVVAGGSCAAGLTYIPAQTCTVNALFTPLYPGRRDGAVRVVSSDGRLLGSASLSANASGSLPVLSPGRIDTVAGDRSWVYTGDGVSAVGAPIFLPQGLAVDVAGNLYLSDSSNSRIRRVDASTGLISTVVGNGTPGFNGDGLAGPQTSVSQPAGLALDGAGNLYFADAGNSAIRRLDALSGLVTTVAGQPGSGGYAGDGGLATAAKLTLPEGLAFDAAGDLLIADTGNSVVRVVQAGTGIIGTFAGTGAPGFSGDGALATHAALNTPWNLTVAQNGSVLIADFGNDRVRSVSIAGIITTLVGSGTRGFAGDEGPPTQAELSEPAGLALDPAGNLYIADSGNNRVRMVSVADGSIHTVVGNSGDSFSGDGGPANEASLYGPYALFFSAGGDLFIADIFHNRVRRVSAHALTLNYATIRVSKTSSPQAEGVLNDGNAALTLSAPALVNAALDTGTTTCLNGPVAPGAGCTLGVEFAPTVIGTQVQGSVTVNSGGSAPAPVITVQGQVLSVEPTVTTIAASANPALLGAGVTLTATVSSADSGRSGPITFYDGQTVLCSTTIGAGGVATCTVSSLTLGQHGLTASYDGDANNASSVSATLTEVIKQAPTLLLAVSPNPAVITANVTLSLSARAATGTPTGTVTFYDGTTALGTAVLDGAGNASLSTTHLAPGTHTLQVQYAGDNANMVGGSNVVSEAIQQASTLATLATTAATLDVGLPFTLTAQVSASTGPLPTGTVQFNEGSIALGTGTLDNRGIATLTLSNLAPGTHLILANYSGDSNDAASASTLLSENITQIATTTVLGADSNPLSAGATLRLTASVALAPGGVAAGALSGNVSFYEGSTLLGTTGLDPAGHASVAVPGLSVGAHSITAVFAGSTNYASSTSAALPEAVAQTATTVSAAASSNATLAGKPLGIAVTVSSATGIPTGAVALRDGTAVLSQSSLSANGTASFSLSSLGVGSHALTVTYAGDANYSGSSSAATSITVSLAQPTLVLSGPTAAVNVGTLATFTAVLNSNGVVPTGSLTLRDGVTPIATQTIAGSGTLSFSLTTLALGLHNVAVTYAGDANNAAVTSGAASVTIQQAPTATVLTSSTNPVTLGEPLTLVAIVTSDSPQLSGVVSFTDGASLLGTATLGADGKASFTTTALPAGVHTLNATYAGDANHAASAATALSERVVLPTAAVLSSSLNPATSGLAVTLSAKLSPAAAGQTAVLPTGSVTFSDGAAVLGSAVLDATGLATLSTSSLSVGVHALRLVYTGDLNFSSASAGLTQTIASASTQVGLTASANPASFAAPLTFTASVSSNGGPATGNVVFSDGGATLGSAPLNAAGVAQLSLTTLAPGDHTLAASYAGDGRASASASAPLAITVKQDTTLVLTSASNPALTLNPVVFTASVLNAGAVMATGTITFTDGGVSLGTGTLDAFGHAIFTLPQMTAGRHTIAASYVGDGKNFGSTSTPFAETVQLRSTLTAITSSATAADDPQQVTLIAVVRGDGPVMPSGKVTFRSGTGVVGTSLLDATGVATLTLHLDVAQESVTASYGGDAAFAASDSAASTITAGAATQFTLAVNPSSVTIASKQHILVAVALHSVKGFNDTLKLGCLGLPFAATCTFSNPQMALAANGDATVQLTIDTGNPLGAAAEVSALDTRKGGAQGRGVLLCLLPVGLIAGLSLRRRQRFRQVTLLVLSAVALAATLSGCSGLQVNGTPAGTYAFKVTASGAGTGATQSQTVSLTVTQ